MSYKTPIKAEASEDLDGVFSDFILAPQAMLCTPGTLRLYRFTAGRFVAWLINNGVQHPTEIEPRHVRAYLGELADDGLADSTIHGHARAVRTLLRFLKAENYIQSHIPFPMPKIAKKRLLVLSGEEVGQLLKVCRMPRDKALVLLLVDSGVRRAQALALNWGDVDIESGMIRIKGGKGGKSRTVVVGTRTRRALVRYRRTVQHKDDDPLIQSRSGARMTNSGLRSLLLRVGEVAGVHVTPHALRRTFATLCLRAGMNLIQLQALMGHSSLDMTRQYIEMLDDDLLQAHQEHGSVDKLL